ncbi:MAG: hypothetical protein V4437_00110, partial [Patescibacteria group bacterium]
RYFQRARKMSESIETEEVGALERGNSQNRLSAFMRFITDAFLYFELRLDRPHSRNTTPEDARKVLRRMRQRQGRTTEF